MNLDLSQMPSSTSISRRTEQTEGQAGGQAGEETDRYEHARNYTTRGRHRAGPRQVLARKQSAHFQRLSVTMLPAQIAFAQTKGAPASSNGKGPGTQIAVGAALRLASSQVKASMGVPPETCKNSYTDRAKSCD